MKTSKKGEQQRTRSRCFKIAVMAVSGIAALGGVVMLLWNWLVPTLFAGAQTLGYWQALGLLLLSKILFGGFRGDFRGRREARRERLEDMTAEERERLKQRSQNPWAACCERERRGDGGSDGSGKPDSSVA